MSAAAGKAALEVILQENILSDVNRKGQMFIEMLSDHPKIKDIHGIGLLISVRLESEDYLGRFMERLVDNGLVTDVFLFARDSFRIGPPLVITDDQIKEIVAIIRKTLDEVE